MSHTEESNNNTIALLNSSTTAGNLLKNHMLIQNKNKIDNIVFTCAILHNHDILLDFDEWNDSDDGYDIANDIESHSLDPRI
jgi:hypothetical protein